MLGLRQRDQTQRQHCRYNTDFIHRQVYDFEASIYASDHNFFTGFICLKKILTSQMTIKKIFNERQ